MINAAVLGSPINHSLSPLLHSLAYTHLGIEARYEAIEVRAGELANFLTNTDKSAFSLTMPLKEEAVALARNTSPIAQRISSGNTLFKSDGVWNLTSTDVEGFKYALLGHGITHVKKCLVIGAGATARAAVAAVSSLSDSIEVINRNPDRQHLMNQAAEGELTFSPWEQPSDINTADLVINTTPSHVADFFQSSIVSPQGVLFEVLYHPWPTAISKSWADSGAVVIDGLDLLIHQAISQVEIFGQVTINRSEMYGLMRQASLAHLG